MTAPRFKTFVLAAAAVLVAAAAVFLVGDDMLVLRGALSRDPVLLNDLGNRFFGGGAYDLGRAEYFFTRAIKLDPDVPDAWHQLARIDFLRGDFDGALEKINRQIELHGETLMASFYIRGLIEGYRGDLQTAEADFKKFLSWDPGNWAAANDLAWVYFKAGKYGEAEKAADAGLKRHAGNPWLLLMRGVSRGELGRRAEALEDLKGARAVAGVLTPDVWSRAYPGNDPRQATAGLATFRSVIDDNIRLFSADADI